MTYQYITKHTSPNFSYGRPMGSIDGIVIHYWDDPARKPSFEGVVSWLCRPNGTSSAHYVAEAGRVACLVAPANRAWHAGPTGNPRKIGIECNPRMSAGDLETVAELIADLRKTYGNLPLTPHKAYMNTSCPGSWQGKLEWLDRRANELLGKATGTRPAPAATPAINYNPNRYSAAYVGEVQQRLRARGYNIGASGVDKVLGKDTWNAIKKFQKDHGLVQDGIPGVKTMAKLRAGSANSQVIAVQKAVKAVPDGVSGTDTKKRVNAVRMASLYFGTQFPYGVAYTQRVVGTKADKVWGEDSKKKHDLTVIRIQRAVGAKVDGIWGVETDRKVRSVIG